MTRTAVVTGAGTGLGAATAVAFAREGTDVVLVGRREELLRTTAKAVEAEGARAVVVPGDVSEEATAERAVAAATAELGGIDVLVNNAGIHAHPVLLHESSVEEFDRFLAIDLRGPFLLTRAVLPSMIERGGGAVLNVASMAGLVGFKYSSAYTTAKAGLIGLTRATAVDYGPHRIRANCICPGGMGPVEQRDISPAQRDLLMEAVGVGGGMLLPEAVCHVDDMAALIVFLCGPRTPTLTGAVIPVDAGFTAH
jgi:NAD(P)-dependent dehydrogenase (short-subunit alcohol dehydrogenase family)